MAGRENTGHAGRLDRPAGLEILGAADQPVARLSRRHRRTVRGEATSQGLARRGGAVIERTVMEIDYRHIIIGGGTYGCFAALKLAELDGGGSVVILEREPDIMLRASYNNQARVHNGYHYPRSLLTALRSRINAPRFLAEFKDAIFASSEQHYAISRHQSNVTASQFAQFCRRIGADLRPAPAAVKKLFNDELIEAVFSATEHTFDADKLRECLRARIAAAGITVLARTEATRIRPGATLHVEVQDLRSGEARTLRGRYLYNCTYARLNQILSQSSLKTIRLKHEATEI